MHTVPERSARVVESVMKSEIFHVVKLTPGFVLLEIDGGHAAMNEKEE
jgi:hypothetical protein